MIQQKESNLSPCGTCTQQLEDLDTSDLLRLYKETGDSDVKWTIVLRYSDLVKKIALQTRSLFNNFADVDDMIHEGILVLLNGVDHFDPEKGIQFPIYIAKRLRGMVIDQVRKHDWVPRQLRQKSVQLNRISEELAVQLGHTPSRREMAGHLGVSVEEYDAMRSEAAVSSLVSFEGLLEAYGSTGGEQSLGESETGRPEEICQEKELHEVLSNGIASLRKNEQTVLSLYYEKELTMKEIAKVMGVSAPRVSQIHSSALQHLETYMQQYLNA